jgi:hypothetical protein
MSSYVHIYLFAPAWRLGLCGGKKNEKKNLSRLRASGARRVPGAAVGVRAQGTPRETGALPTNLQQGARVRAVRAA